MKTIKIKDLSVGYKKTNVIENLDVNFDADLINVIIGESGCGKTTLLKCLLNQLDYTGNIYFDDIDISNLSTKDLNIGYVSQNIILYPHLTVFENIAFPLSILHCSKEEIERRVMEIAEDLEIKLLLNRKPRQLSLGQQQRVSIARALIKKPEICLFDEPLSNLDEQNRYKLRIKIKQIIKKYHITTIYVTHNRLTALSLGDMIYCMDNGKFVLNGTQTELLASDNELVKDLLSE